MGVRRELASSSKLMRVTPDKREDWRGCSRAHGIALGRDKVEGIYLRPHSRHDGESVEPIRRPHRVPDSAFGQTGKLQLVIKTAGKQSYLLEQPFYVTVEEPKETGEVAASSK